MKTQYIKYLYERQTFGYKGYLYTVITASYGGYSAMCYRNGVYRLFHASLIVVIG